MEQADILAVQAGRPWRNLPAAMLAPAKHVPTMLTAEETALYVWLGARAKGLGATIDLGAFAGGSAARLMTGLAASGAPYHLHAYDRFTAKKESREKHLYPFGIPETNDNDLLPLVQRLLEPWQGHFTLHRGDIGQVTWDGGPVEILAVDAGKTPELADRIAETFFPALIPGQSVLIQEDFLHTTQPWLAVQMRHLTDCFAPLASVAGGCVAFQCIAAVPPEALAKARTTGLSDRQLIDGLREAATCFEPFLPKDPFRAMIKKVKANPGERVAWRMWRD